MTKPNYCIHEGHLYKEVAQTLFSTWEKIDMPILTKIEPVWKGAKIPMSLWRNWVTFAKLSHQKTKSESMALLFYDLEKNEWSMWYPPQEGRGMAVSLLNKDPSYAEQRKRFPDTQFGTIHHHCNTSAFQSGTDKNDEVNRDGIHITLGDMDRDCHSIHVRLTIGDTSQTVTDLTGVFETPAWFMELPDQRKFKNDVLTALLCTSATKEEIASFDVKVLDCLREERWKPQGFLEKKEVSDHTYSQISFSSNSYVTDFFTAFKNDLLLLWLKKYEKHNYYKRTSQRDRDDLVSFAKETTRITAAVLPSHCALRKKFAEAHLLFGDNLLSMKFAEEWKFYLQNVYDDMVMDFMESFIECPKITTSTLQLAFILGCYLISNPEAYNNFFGVEQICQLINFGLTQWQNQETLEDSFVS